MVREFATWKGDGETTPHEKGRDPEVAQALREQFLPTRPVVARRHGDRALLATREGRQHHAAFACGEPPRAPKTPRIARAAAGMVTSPSARFRYDVRGVSNRLILDSSASLPVVRKGGAPAVEFTLERW